MENKLKILVVDDEVLIAEFLKDILISLEFPDVRLAHDQEEAIASINESKPDLVLLDIRMKKKFEGIETARLLNEKYRIPFIYITAHFDKEIVDMALDTKPAGYLTKPFKKMDVFAAVQIAAAAVADQNKNFLVFKDGYENVKISLSDVLYAQSDNNYIHIFTTQKKYTLRNTLDWFTESVPQQMFHRTHRSYVVNISKVTKTSSKSVFINTIEIPVSRGNQFYL